MLAAAPSSPGHIDTLAAIDLSWKVGDVVAGQFVLRGELGRGGMSCVWDAYDTVMRRCVALKTTIDRARGDDTLIHEARALAAVKHRGLPTPYSLGRYLGWTYLAIERLYGVTIEQRLLHPERGRPAFTIEEAIRILIEVADVLAAVHVAGMAHHDVKPSNVMLCQGDRVALLDFGIMIPEVVARDARPAGTPRYLAPEMLLDTIVPGQARLLDTYAFGVMAFEMLAGVPPFHADDTHELMRMHIADRAPDLLQFRADVPTELADLIDTCLAKSPGQRPATMDEIAWELRAMPPVRARPRTQTMR